MRELSDIGRGELAPEKQPHSLPVEDMLEILRLIVRVEPLEIILQRIVDTIANTYQMRYVTLGLLDEETGLFFPKALHGYPPERVVAIRRHAYTLGRMKTDLKPHLKIGRTCYYVRAEDQTTSYDDATDYILRPELVDMPRESPSDWHELDYIDYVMTDRLGNWIGWIEIDEPKDRVVPSKEVIDRIQMLADIAALAVEGTKSYEVAINAIGDSQAYLEFITRDIGGKINPLSYFINSLASPEVPEERKMANAESAIEVLTSLKDLVDNIRKYSDIRASITLPKHRYNLREVLELCTRSLKRTHSDRNIKVTVECEEQKCMAVADELIFDLFSSLLNHSVENSIGEDVSIDVRISEEYSAVTVQIEDHSRGIPDSRKNLVFNRFAWRPDGGQSSDLGLSIAALLVERYNGLISVRDRVPGDSESGACFEVSLPKVLENADARLVNQY